MKHLRLTALFLLVLMGSCSAEIDSEADSTLPPSSAESQNRTILPDRRGLNPAKTLDRYTLTSWSTADGLPQNSVQALVQSDDGYLWLGTQEGLVRFNGSEFRTFDRSNTEGILSNDITSIVQTSPGVLWVGTVGGGIFRLSGTAARSYTTDDGLPSNAITTIVSDSTGRRLIGTTEHGFTIMEDESFTTYTSEDGLPGDGVQSILCHSDGDIWIGTSNGLARFSSGHIEDVSGRFGLGGIGITALAEGPEGIWAGTTDGLFLIEGGQARVYTTSEGLASDWIMSLHVDVDGNLVAGTTEGVSLFSDGRFNSFSIEGGLVSNLIGALLVDREGSLWMGTATNGLKQLREAVITTYSTSHGLMSDIIYCVEGSRHGGVWIGSYIGDIDLYRDGRIENILPAARLGRSRLRALYEDSAGRLWIGTESALCLFAGGELSVFTEEDGLPNVPVRVVKEDRNGTIWVGMDGAGLYQFRNGHLFPFKPEPDLPSQAVRAIFQGSGEEIWIGTNGGLSVLRQGGIVNYTVDEGLPFALVRTIHESGDGTLWIGTYGGGLIRFKDGEFTSFTSRDGLYNDTIYQILEDSSDNLWMSSNTGIFTVSKTELDEYEAGLIERIESTAYRESDGMRNRECNGGSPGGFLSAPDKQLFFPTIAGLAVVDLEVTRKPQAPPVVIERILADSEELDISGPLDLPPHRIRVAFEYTALSFIAPEKINYHYQLEGFDPGWVAAGGRRIAEYTRLRPGSYCFYVTASYDEDPVSAGYASIPFTIRPAFYQTLWFLLASIALITGLAYRGYRRRIDSLKKQELVLQARVDEALAEMTVLQGLLPICSHCKKIRDDQGYWSKLEVYIHDHSEAEFSHSLCPECRERYYPDFKSKRSGGSQEVL